MNRRTSSQDIHNPPLTIVGRFSSATELVEHFSVIQGDQLVNDAETEPETALDSEWEADLDGFEEAEEPVRIYLREIGRIKLLTKADEYNLARRIEACKYIEALESELGSVEGELPGAWVCVTQILSRVWEAEHLIDITLVVNSSPTKSTTSQVTRLCMKDRNPV